MPEDTDTSDEESEFAANARKAMEENSRLKKESALLRAGVDPDSDEGKMVSRLVPDEFTPETVRETVDTLRSTFGGAKAEEPPPPAEPDPATDERRQAAQEQSAVTQGIGDRVPEPPPPDALKAGYEKYDEARRRGTSQEDAAHHVLGAIMNDVAANGSASVHAWEGWSEDARKREAQGR